MKVEVRLVNDVGIESSNFRNFSGSDLESLYSGVCCSGIR